jgi:hypothetical protein
MITSKHMKIVAASATALAATGAVAASGGAQTTPETLELVQRGKETRSKFVDAPPRRRESPGDMFTISGPVRTTSGARAGRAEAVFVQTSRTTAQGSVTFKLRRGSVMALGAVGTRGADDLAITGGTGDYASVSGIATVSPGPRETQFLLVLER